MVLERLRKFGLYCKRSKCALHIDTANFLGYIISPRGMSMEPRRIETIMSWLQPTSVHQIQVFWALPIFTVGSSISARVFAHHLPSLPKHQGHRKKTEQGLVPTKKKKKKKKMN